MVGSLSESYSWGWEEGVSSKERKEAAVFRTKYSMHKEMAYVHYEVLCWFMQKDKSQLIGLNI